MPFEYAMLTILTIFFTIAWMPASVGKAQSFGMKWLASNRDKKPERQLPDWAQRCERAYENLKNYFPAFLVAIILLGILNKFDETTIWLSAVFVGARFIHFLAYGLGNVSFRFLSFAVSLLANLILLAKVFV